MLGITFKENCPDVRNTKIVDVIKALEDYGIQITIFDPWANPSEVLYEYGLKTVNQKPLCLFDAVILGVAHTDFLNLDIPSLRKECSILYDVKGVLEEGVDGRL
jgi:UDP-N-acetyl-D-glucosamine/UDP-N-acetyl-D-galactosamine dehydrogenase